MKTESYNVKLRYLEVVYVCSTDYRVQLGTFSVILGILTFYFLITLDIDYHIGFKQEKEVRGGQYIYISMGC